jgi:YVTN family beta-propeller protein
MRRIASTPNVVIVRGLVAALVALALFIPSLMAAPINGRPEAPSGPTISAPISLEALVHAKSSPIPAASAAIPPYHFHSTHLPNYGGQPTWLAYDHGVRSWYVAYGNGVAVISGSTLTGTHGIGTGDLAFGVAYDPTDARIFVTNSLSNNVTAISDRTNATVGSAAVGVSPFGVAYDNSSNSIFVANGGSDTVTELNATSLTLLRTIPVGRTPVGVVYDSQSGDVFVANEGSANVTVVAGGSGKVLRSVSVGPGPYDAAVDSKSGQVYVSLFAAGRVVVLNSTGTTIIASIPTGGTPAGIAYDSTTQTVWVADGSLFVVVINASSHHVLSDLLFDPLGAAFDPDTGNVCVTNSANSTFQCLTSAAGYGVQSTKFHESGLPKGTVWGVTLFSNVDGSAVALSSRHPSIPFDDSGIWSFEATPVSGYTASFVGWSPGWVNFTYSSAPGEYAVTFVERGIQLSPFDGFFWTVNVSGKFYGTTLTTLTVLLKNGTYTFAGGFLSGYTNVSRTFAVTGAPLIVKVTFHRQIFTAAFQETGLPKGTVWQVTLDGATVTSSSRGLSFSLPDGTYPFQGFCSGYTANPTNGIISVFGGRSTVSVTFS